ncbi:hypothetical protein VIGAN_09217800 [Vigna angularis var. angularis]|uniref:Uncharacterized protein n=1 Tax=Vigna angularis var. angularis TaxID=157739 RepID=A0A0S3T014_PHAAN|nr:hypothetical protein VIGAN_09217800 [Vigna angularis var. angularis]
MRNFFKRLMKILLLYILLLLGLFRKLLKNQKIITCSQLHDRLLCLLVLFIHQIASSLSNFLHLGSQLAISLSKNELIGELEEIGWKDPSCSPPGDKLMKK